MSQAALNTRNGDEEEVNSSRRNNGTRLAGILFLLTVLCTVFVSGWVADSARQDKLMPDSMIYQAISEKPQGPYKMLRSIGAGCHPEVFKLADNSYMISVQGGYYSAKSLEGLWTFHTFGFGSVLYVFLQCTLYTVFPGVDVFTVEL